MSSQTVNVLEEKSELNRVQKNGRVLRNRRISRHTIAEEVSVEGRVLRVSRTEVEVSGRRNCF